MLELVVEGLILLDKYTVLSGILTNKLILCVWPGTLTFVESTKP